MNISTSTQNFSSIKNPIKPFDIKTTKGNLHVFEVTKDTKNYKRIMKQADLFAYKNIESASKTSFLSRLKNYIKILKAPNRPLTENTTILVAKNDRGKICASIMANPNEISSKTLDISNVAVAKKYRHNNVFQKLYNSLENAIKKSGKVETISLDAVNSAIPVYKKIGFKETTKAIADSATHTNMQKNLKEGIEYITSVGKNLLKKI